MVMAFSDASLTALRVFREVAERGTLTAAAAALGYTQSAVSRQIASLERAAGTPLLERRHDGVRLTPAGRIVVRRAASVVDQVDATARELAGLPDEHGTVRLGWFASAGAALVPRALATLRRTHPAITVISGRAALRRWSAPCAPAPWTSRCWPRRHPSPTRHRDPRTGVADAHRTHALCGRTHRPSAGPG
ncbi:hypothetical protein GCM10027614_04340 [Micromonospora vulcania]